MFRLDIAIVVCDTVIRKIILNANEFKAPAKTRFTKEQENQDQRAATRAGKKNRRHTNGKDTDRILFKSG